jgi:hypothetical protein
MDQKRVAKQLRRYRERLERDAAERRLEALEARLADLRERRGMQPIMSDTGAILGWVDTLPQAPGGR